MVEEVSWALRVRGEECRMHVYANVHGGKVQMFCTVG